MARFVFKLEVVLRQRRRAEQEAQRELAVRLAKLVTAEDELRRLDAQLKSVTEDVRKNHLLGTIDLGFLAAHRRFLNAMQRQGMVLVQKIAAAQKQVDEARLALAEAAKRRKAIDRLREKQLEQWRSEQSRREMALLDEIGSQIGYANVADSSDKDRSVEGPAAAFAAGDLDPSA